jgi:DNA-binding transcriptional LysR family regulator
MSAGTPTERRDPWLGIELRHLAALSAIESEGTFSEAALSLGYVQSAVSGQLAMLERLIGTRLVERSRGPGPQRLTAAGELLLEHARDILGELEAAREGLAAAETEEPHGLRVALAPGLADGIVASLLTTIVSEGELALAGVQSLEADGIGRALERRDADVAVLDRPLVADEIATAEITLQPPVLVVRADSPLSRSRHRPTLEELSRLPFVAWREGRCPSRIEHEFAERGLTVNVVARADSSDSAASMVESGLGAAVLPRSAVPPGAALAAVELSEALPLRFTGIAWLRARSGEHVIRRFVDLACTLREAS